MTGRDPIPEDDLVEEIQRLTDELGRPPAYKDMSERGQYTLHPYNRAFDSWRAALEAAGVEDDYPQMDGRERIAIDTLVEYDAASERELLKRWYVDEGLTQKEIADRVRNKSPWVSSLLEEHDLLGKGESSEDVEFEGREQIKRWYWIEGLTQTEIGDRLGWSKLSVMRYMDREDIPTRTQGSGSSKVYLRLEDVPDPREDA